MIVESSSLTTIGVGASKTQTEVGDAALKIPNIVLPVIQLIEPTQIAPLAAQVNTQSFHRSAYAARNNAIAISFLFCTLGRGYWNLDFLWTHSITFAAPFPFNSNGNYVNLVSPIGGISSLLGSLLPVQNGSFTTRWSNTLLLRESSEIYLGIEVCGAADYIETNLHLTATKIL